MKKLIAIGLVVASFAATSSSFAQGYFDFVTSKSQAYDGTGATAVLNSTIDVTFLWAPANTTLSGILSAASSKTGNNTTTAAQAGYTAATAWTAILASGFTPAVNTNGNTAAVQLTVANGGASYNGGASFGVSGTAGTTPSTVYSVFMVGWNASSGDTTLAAAAAHGDAVGWGTVFQYSAGANGGASVGNFTGQTGFGVFSPVVVPEPTTLALAGLSGASLLLFRRRK